MFGDQKSPSQVSCVIHSTAAKSRKVVALTPDGMVRPAPPDRRRDVSQVQVQNAGEILAQYSHTCFVLAVCDEFRGLAWRGCRPTRSDVCACSSCSARCRFAPPSPTPTEPRVRHAPTRAVLVLYPGRWALQSGARNRVACLMGWTTVTRPFFGDAHAEVGHAVVTRQIVCERPVQRAQTHADADWARARRHAVCGSVVH